MGSQYGTSVLFSGFVQGLGAEIIFAIFVYRKFNLPVSLLAGAASGLFCGLNDSFAPWGWNIAYSGARTSWPHRLLHGLRSHHRRRAVLDRHPRFGAPPVSGLLRLAQGRHGARFLLMPAAYGDASAPARPAAVTARGWGWRHARQVRPAVNALSA